MYFNFKSSFKINFTYTYIDLNIQIIFVKRKIKINRQLFYNVLIRKLLGKRNEKTLEKYKKGYIDFRKYAKYVFKFMIVKNIDFYVEESDTSKSFVLSFDIVNNVFKKSILNG